MDRTQSALRRLMGVALIATFCFFLTAEIRPSEDLEPLTNVQWLSVAALLAWLLGTLGYGLWLLLTGRTKLLFVGILLLTWLLTLTGLVTYVAEAGAELEMRMLVTRPIGAILFVPLVVLVLDCLLCYLEHRRKAR